MTTALLELNDHQLKLTVDKQSWLSTGFATLAPKGVLFGEKAQQQARLQPRLSYNQYWNLLSLAPIETNNPKFRHYGDFAYQQLLELVSQAGGIDEVILSVPASFDREQLSLLLGIFGQFAFKVVGLVDSSVAAVANTPLVGRIVYLDIQLHQCLLTELSVNENVKVKRADIFAGTGLTQLYQHWAKFLSAQFIQQCRFDPLHEADTEQQLYNTLEALLFSTDDDIQLEIKGKKIKLNRQSLLRHTQGLFEPVIKALSHVGPIDTLLVSERIATIPELFNQLDAAITVNNTAIVDNCLAHQKHICPDGDGLSLVTQLPAHQGPVKVKSKGNNGQKSTHILLQNAAYPLGEKPLYIVTDKELSLTTERNGKAHFSLTNNGGNLTVTALNGREVLINGQPGSKDEQLDNGDTLSFSYCSGSLTLINVLKGEYC
ncbi:MAG: hypothetical protein HRT35_22720 [Algicola sp.]|nr:hypothetical protein [Algicola sp.]